jgi:hypothetical protein
MGVIVTFRLLCLQGSCRPVSSESETINSGGKKIAHELIYIYSDTSANEDNSFRNHIR